MGAGAPRVKNDRDRRVDRYAGGATIAPPVYSGEKP
jgi:hypothetical protein